MLSLSSIRTLLEKCLQNALVNFGSRCNTISFGNPWCIHHPLRKGYAVPTIGTMCANLANHSTITKMASHPCDSGKLVMKSMHIPCHGLNGIGNSFKRPTCFWSEIWFTWHFIQVFTKWVISSSMRGQWYLFDTTLWWFFSPLWLAMGLSYFSFEIKCLNLPCGTYTHLCLYLSNPSTNLTSLSALPLRSSPRSLCASG